MNSEARVQSSHRYLLGALLLAVGITLLTQLPHLLDPMSVEPDFRKFHLAYRLENPELFPGKTWGELELSSPLYVAILWGASTIMPPELASKLFVYPLILISAYFLFQIGLRLRGPGTGLALALAFTVFVLATDPDVSVTGGLQRSFALPLLIAEMSFLMQHRFRHVFAVIVFMGLIYLPILPVAVLTAASVIFLEREDGAWRLAIQRKYLFMMIAATGLTFLAVLPFLESVLFVRLQESIALMRQGEHMLRDPVYGPDGPRPMFYAFPFFGRGGLVVQGSAVFQFLILSLLSGVMLVVLRDKRQRLPPVFRNLFLASMAVYFVSWLPILLLSTPLLYLPSRHTQFSLFLCLIVFTVLNSEQTLHRIATHAQQQRERLAYLVLGVIVLAAAAVGLSLANGSPQNAGTLWMRMRVTLMALSVVAAALLLFSLRRKKGRQKATSNSFAFPKHVWPALGAVLLLLSPLYIRVTGPPYHRPSGDALALYAFLQTTPVDTVVAGDACLLNDVPYYAKRNVLYDCMVPENAERELVAGLDAYYAEDGQAVLDFCKQHGVDVLVVDERTLTKALIDERNVTFEPYNSELLPRLAARRQFALAHIEPAQRLFQAGGMYAVSCTEEVLLQERAGMVSSQP